MEENQSVQEKEKIKEALEPDDNENTLQVEDTIREDDSEEKENLEKMKEQARKKAEKNRKKQQKLQEKQKKSGKKCKIAGIVAAIAGILEIFFGGGSSTTICIGITFICIGYFYYNLGKKMDRENKR